MQVHIPLEHCALGPHGDGSQGSVISDSNSKIGDGKLIRYYFIKVVKRVSTEGVSLNFAVYLAFSVWQMLFTSIANLVMTYEQSILIMQTYKKIFSAA